jgi:hypothetical protein
MPGNQQIHRRARSAHRWEERTGPRQARAGASIRCGDVEQRPAANGPKIRAISPGTTVAALTASYAFRTKARPGSGLAPTVARSTSPASPAPRGRMTTTSQPAASPSSRTTHRAAWSRCTTGARSYSRPTRRKPGSISPRHRSRPSSRREAALGPDQFEWFRVDRAVGNVRNQGPGLASRSESLPR